MKRLITLITLVAALMLPGIATAQRMPAKANMRLSQFKAPAAAPRLAEEEPIMLSYKVPSGASMMGSSSTRAGAAAGALNCDNLMPLLTGMR